MAKNSAGDAGEGLVPNWMTAALLLAALSGLLLMLNEGRVSLFGNPYGDFPSGAAPEPRFVDRAQLWLSQGLSGAAGIAALLALSGFVVILLDHRRRGTALSNRFRVCGLLLGGVLAALEASGSVALLIGYRQLLTDSTAARDLADQLRFQLPNLVLCLVLAVLFAALTWILSHARDDADQPVNETAPAAPAELPIEDDPQRVNRPGSRARSDSTEGWGHVSTEEVSGRAA